MRTHCRKKGVRIFGDLPIYVPFHSADVWAHPQLFKLDDTGSPVAVSGVPPDYFSTDGQLWGHPVYRWDVHRDTRYEWWVLRFARNLALFDHVRIDHFRGLVAYWEVPAHEPTAANGKWVQTPAEDFFSELRHRFVCLPVIAEDLGVITADVRETMQRFGFPGMRVLLFGFSEDPATNVNALHHIPENGVVFTGTHDNNTVKGWFETEASAAEKRRLKLTLGREPAADTLHWDMIRLAMMSPARMCIIPVQDLLGLGPEARINTPGRWEGNWLWRMSPGQFDALPLTAAPGVDRGLRPALIASRSGIRDGLPRPLLPAGRRNAPEGRAHDRCSPRSHSPTGNRASSDPIACRPPSERSSVNALVQTPAGRSSQRIAPAVGQPHDQPRHHRQTLLLPARRQPHAKPWAPLPEAAGSHPPVRTPPGSAAWHSRHVESRKA